MTVARPSLAWKIATANILLALFAVLLAGMLQYGKERRILAATMRRELAQVVTSGALLIDGEKAEGLAQGGAPAETAPMKQVFRSLLISSPEVDRTYVVGRGPDWELRFLLGQGVGPGAVISAPARECLEQLLLRTTRGLFVIVTYLVLEAQTGELCYATGGHLPILRRHGATREVEILYGDEGLPLGIEKNSLLTDRKIRLAADDTLLLVTDGVVEALCPDRNVFRMEPLAEVFRRADSGAGQLVEEIFEQIGRICATAPEDDLTVLALTWTPQQRGAGR